MIILTEMYLLQSEWRQQKPSSAKWHNDWTTAKTIREDAIIQKLPWRRDTDDSNIVSSRKVEWAR